MKTPSGTVRSRAPGLAAATLGALALVGASSAGPPPFELRQETVLVLRVDVLDVLAGRTADLGTHALEIAGDEPSSLSITLPWPSADAASRLVVAASGTPAPEGQPSALSVRSELRRAGSPPVLRTRALEAEEGSTYLMEAAANGSRRLVLALRAETLTRPVLVDSRSVGPPVRFRLAVERLDGDRTVHLETNHLQTFLGEAVEYEFRRGSGDLAEHLDLSLRPVRLDGDLAEVLLEVTGSLPGTEDRLLLSRRDTLFTTRRATSTLAVAAGDPPAGYRFLITPDF